MFVFNDLIPGSRVHSGVWFGILVESCKERIRIFSNDFHNIKGSLVNVKKGGPVQFAYCTGGGYRCQDNAIEQVRDESSIIDHISAFNSMFDASNPYIVRNNWIRGGGPSPSSGGILLGDYGGSNMIMEDNILVNPGQYGIAVAGGSNMVMRRNKVYGEQLPWSNVGIVVVNWTWQTDGPSENITVAHNRVNWIGSHGGDAPFWVWEEMQWPIGWDTNTFQDPTITPNILPAEIVGV
ncbi:right-handed parallel beta-helix repeat-containing protein [uncultured Proteiniphilum sp.]|uniref:right-handed parallel beta-helix repeat-containing protein n=1 Tax=uncultured Proteiniphilum sp. TaxID=497637 RepID=UPI0026081BDB|nr:right-handed parallel beta-helix repeat-containing protein [uncultured Proteiniphilum sp.]